MPTTVNYGEDAVSLEFPGAKLVASYLEPSGHPLDDLASAVVAALDEPLDLPAFRQMVLPDDRVTIALEEHLVDADEIVGGVVQALLSAGTTPELICILRTQSDKALTATRLLRKLPNACRDRIQVLTHDPADRGCLSYLAVSNDDKPIYINRALCDADVVLPIGALRAPGALGYLGVHQSWFPAFADLETQQRFLKPQSSLSGKHRRRRQHECEEAAWLLGIQLILQLIPGGAKRPLHVLAGTPAAVAKRGVGLCEDAWSYELPRRASLVVAAIGGGREQQTWNSVAQTLSTALEAVEEGGAVAICSQLRDKPGPALRRVARAGSWEDAVRAVRRQHTADAVPAAQLLKALQRVRVYLLSELDEDVVEDLGLAYVAKPEEIANLSTHYNSCVVLGNAQYAIVSLVAENGA